MKASEIEALISEYNAVEQAQEKRLEQLYLGMKDRKGGSKQITFSNGTRWTANAWQNLPDRLSLPKFVGDETRIITSFYTGDPEPGEE